MSARTAHRLTGSARVQARTKPRSADGRRPAGAAPRGRRAPGHLRQRKPLVALL